MVDLLDAVWWCQLGHAPSMWLRTRPQTPALTRMHRDGTRRRRSSSTPSLLAGCSAVAGGSSSTPRGGYPAGLTSTHDTVASVISLIHIEYTPVTQAASPDRWSHSAATRLFAAQSRSKVAAASASLGSLGSVGRRPRLRLSRNGRSAAARRRPRLRLGRLGRQFCP